MLYVYIVMSAAVMLLLNVPFKIFTSAWSLWAVPLIFIGLFVTFVILHCLVLLLAILCTDTKKPARDTDIFRFIVNGFLEIAFKLLNIKIHSTGLEKIPQDECFLLVCNHIHDLDPAIIYYQVPDARLAFIGKKDIEKEMPIVFKALHKLSGLLIDRENNREAVKTIVNATRLINEGKNSVAIFPEGYTSRDGQLQTMRNGAFKIATKSKSKIVVCSLVGTREILKNLFKRKTDIYFDVIEVIDTAEQGQTTEIGEKVYGLMSESIEKHK